MAYFRVPLRVPGVIAAADPDPEVLAAYLVLRRFAFGKNKKLTAAGAKKIARTLGISWRRGEKLLLRLLALRYGERGELALVMTAAEHNEQTGQDLPTKRRNAPVVYYLPDPGGECAYLPDGLIPPGDVRSRLAGLCDLDDRQCGFDAIHTLLQLYHATSYGDFCGADPDLFASCDGWSLDGYAGNNDLKLGRLMDHIPKGFGDVGRRYWLVQEADTPRAPTSVIEAVTGGHDPACVARFWRALQELECLGFMNKVAIVLDARGRLLYPLWVYGKPSRMRHEDLGVKADLARVFSRRTRYAEQVERLAVEANQVRKSGERSTGVFVCATRTDTPPVVCTVYAPTLAAPTPENMNDLKDLASRTQKWL